MSAKRFELMQKIYDGVITSFASGEPITQNNLSKVTGVSRSTITSIIARKRKQLKNKKD